MEHENGLTTADFNQATLGKRKSGHAMNEPSDFLTTVRADALFASSMSAWTDPTFSEVCAAIRQTVCTHGGARGCAGVVAAAFGDYPEVAVLRMRWVRTVVRST